MKSVIINCPDWREGDRPLAGRCLQGKNGGCAAANYCVFVCRKCSNQPQDWTRMLAGLDTAQSDVSKGNDFIALAIQYCGQVCGKRRTVCQVTICKIRAGFTCPEDKWKNIPR